MNSQFTMGNNVIDIGRRVRQRPSSQLQTRLRSFQAAEAEHEANDGVVQAAVGASTAELLRLQLVELAREAAILKFDRVHANDARERQRICSRRIKALRAVASAVVELAQIEQGQPSPGATRRILSLLLEEVRTAAGEVLTPIAAERLAAVLRDRVAPIVEDIADGRVCPSP